MSTALSLQEQEELAKAAAGARPPMALMQHLSDCLKRLDEGITIFHNADENPPTAVSIPDSVGEERKISKEAVVLAYPPDHDTALDLVFDENFRENVFELRNKIMLFQAKLGSLSRSTKNIERENARLFGKQKQLIQLEKSLSESGSKPTLQRKGDRVLQTRLKQEIEQLKRAAENTLKSVKELRASIHFEYGPNLPVNIDDSAIEKIEVPSFKQLNEQLKNFLKARNAYIADHSARIPQQYCGVQTYDLKDNIQFLATHGIATCVGFTLYLGARQRVLLAHFDGSPVVAGDQKTTQDNFNAYIEKMLEKVGNDSLSPIDVTLVTSNMKESKEELKSYIEKALEEAGVDVSRRTFLINKNVGDGCVISTKTGRITRQYEEKMIFEAIAKSGFKIETVLQIPATTELFHIANRSLILQNVEATFTMDPSGIMIPEDDSESQSQSKLDAEETNQSWLARIGKILQEVAREFEGPSQKIEEADQEHQSSHQDTALNQKNDEPSQEIKDLLSQIVDEESKKRTNLDNIEQHFDQIIKDYATLHHGGAGQPLLPSITPNYNAYAASLSNLPAVAVGKPTKAEPSVENEQSGKRPGGPS